MNQLQGHSQGQGDHRRAAAGLHPPGGLRRASPLPDQEQAASEPFSHHFLHNGFKAGGGSYQKQESVLGEHEQEAGGDGQPQPEALLEEEAHLGGHLVLVELDQERVRLRQGELQQVDDKGGEGKMSGDKVASSYHHCTASY